MTVRGEGIVIDRSNASDIAAARAAHDVTGEVVVATVLGPCRYPIYATIDPDRPYWIATLKRGRVDYRPIPDGTIDWSQMDTSLAGFHRHIMVIDPETGDVVYDGSANDEG
jgi:hypothetical protein